MAVPRHDASDLLATVERARKLLDDGDVIAARMLASVAYDQAKLVAQYGERFKAAEKLVSKARQMQADALLIETRAKIGIARQWDAATEAGQTLKGRPKSVPNENAFTAAEAGLTRKEIHEARKLAAAEERAPGIVERAIQARIEAGLEPSRANLRAAVGTSSAPKEDRGNNLYETPIEAMHTLIALEQFASVVLDPSCGRGASSRPLEDVGYTVSLADIEDYGTADQFGEVQRVEDFLTSVALDGHPDIVTNPPYGALLNRFVAHALRVHRPRKMALLLNLNFLCGFDDDDRNFAMDENPPSRVLVFKRRLPMMHRDGWDGPEATSRMNTAWFIWEMNEAGEYVGPTEIRRVDWMDYMPAEQAEAAE
ncbi:SAM-dependent methyltransferase [Ensifer adhaerens]|nr:SAM-dependent methyltransferase [Ensifer adhaerens]UAY02271.1 SAM-dependent methyltransferase [Ensifer adhaerens]UAY09652.1 SAM-dependent methyltransferase [Ensifer adhaerens]